MEISFLYYDSLEFPSWGRFYLAATDRGVCRLTFPGGRPEEFFLEIITRYSPHFFIQNPPVFSGVFRQLRRYLEGNEPVRFSVPLDLTGTPFQKKVWEALQEIPYGETSTYGEIARRIGLPKAARAVGQASRSNPVPILVPCHRVLGAQGDLVGFAGGIPFKERLLKLEKSAMRKG